MAFTMVCLEPRIVDLWTSEVDIDRDIGTTVLWADKWPFRFRSQAERPLPLLSTSQEARTVGLKHYALTFNTSFTRKLGVVDIKITTPARIWVNWENDIICPMLDFWSIGRSRSNHLIDFIKRVSSLEVKYSTLRRLAVEASHVRICPLAANVLGLEELVLFPNLSYESMHAIHNGRYLPNKEINLSLATLEEAGINKKSRRLLDSAMIMKRYAELEMEKMIRQAYLLLDNNRWTSFARIPADWKMPEIKLRVLSLRVDSQEYDVSTET